MMGTPEESAPGRRAFTAIGGATAVVVVLLLLWYAREVLLLAFAGLLLGIFLRRLATGVSHRTPLTPAWALALVVIGLLGILGGTFWIRGEAIATEVHTLRTELPQAIEALQQRLTRYDWGRRAVEALPEPGEVLPSDGDAVDRATGIVSSTARLLANVVIIFFLGVVLAGGPRPYVDGLLALVPAAHMPRARAVVRQVYDTLWWWLLGRIASMAFIGLITGIGLLLLDIPLAFVLALLAALLSFIPNLGPILSYVPAGLIALVQGPQKALWVTGLYVGVQFVESYVLDPIIDRKTVYLPPGLTIVAQLVLALVGGLMGVALAAPLAATAVVMVTMLYVQGVLGKQDVQVQAHGRAS